MTTGNWTEREKAAARAIEREAVIDRHGDVWTQRPDGLWQTPETAPFPWEHVSRKWGPLHPVHRSQGGQ